MSIYHFALTVGLIETEKGKVETFSTVHLYLINSNFQFYTREPGHWNACAKELRDVDFDMAITTQEEAYHRCQQRITRASLEEYNIKKRRFDRKNMEGFGDLEGQKRD